MAVMLNCCLANWGEGGLAGKWCASVWRMGSEWRKRKTVQEKCCLKINLCHVFSGISFLRERRRVKGKSRMWETPFDAFADFGWCRFSSFILHVYLMHYTEWYIYFAYFDAVVPLARPKKMSRIRSMCIVCSWFLYCFFIAIERISNMQRWAEAIVTRSLYLHFPKTQRANLFHVK